MGLFSKLFKNKTGEAKTSAIGIEEETPKRPRYMQADCGAIPVFDDFKMAFSVVCANPHGLDVQELVDKGFTVYADNGLVDVSNGEEVDLLYWALRRICSDEFDVSRFDEPGYVTRLINDIGAACKVASNPIEIASAQNSLFSVCVMASKYYLEKHPEFNIIVPSIIHLFS